jgi:hypothetical protein
VIAETLDAAGFVEHEVHSLDFVFRFPSASAWWAYARDTSLRIREAPLDRAEEDEVVAALAEQAAPWTGDDGAIVLPARTWVAVGTA